MSANVSAKAETPPASLGGNSLCSLSLLGYLVVGQVGADPTTPGLKVRHGLSGGMHARPPGFVRPLSARLYWIWGRIPSGSPWACPGGFGSNAGSNEWFATCCVRRLAVTRILRGAGCVTYNRHGSAATWSPALAGASKRGSAWCRTTAQSRPRWARGRRDRWTGVEILERDKRAHNGEALRVRPASAIPPRTRQPAHPSPSQPAGEA